MWVSNKLVMFWLRDSTEVVAAFYAKYAERKKGVAIALELPDIESLGSFGIAVPLGLQEGANEGQGLYVELDIPAVRDIEIILNAALLTIVRRTLEIILTRDAATEMGRREDDR